VGKKYIKKFKKFCEPQRLMPFLDCLDFSISTFLRAFIGGFMNKSHDGCKNAASDHGQDFLEVDDSDAAFHASLVAFFPKATINSSSWKVEPEPVFQPVET
jgi:hypothetical protein